MVGKVLIAIDKANGYSFLSNEYKSHQNSLETNDEYKYINHLFKVAGEQLELTYHRTLEIQEKYLELAENR